MGRAKGSELGRDRVCADGSTNKHPSDAPRSTTARDGARRTEQGRCGLYREERKVKQRLRRIPLPTFVGLALLLLYANALFAANTDKVTLANGDIITCDIQSLKRGILRVGTDSMGDLDIEWTDVVAVTSDQDLLIETVDGSRYFGQLAKSRDPALIIVQVADEDDEDAELHGLVRAQVVLITPIEKKFRDRLDLDLSLGYSFTKSSDVGQLTFGTNALYRAEKYHLRLAISSIRTTQKEAPTSRTQEATVDYRHFLKKRWFALALGGLQENTELGLDLRTFVGGGGGRNVIQTNRSELALTGAVTAAHEEPTEGSETTDSIEAILGLEYRFFVFNTPKRDIVLQFSLIPSLTESGRLRSNFDMRFKLELVTDFFWELRFFASTDDEPPTGAAANTDYGIITSFGYSL